MSLFAWEALDAKGRRKRGELESDSERTARKTLKDQGLIVRRLDTLQDKHKDQQGVQKQSLNADETTLFLQQLSTLTSAGMALTDALEAVAAGMENKRARRAVGFVRQQVLEGSNLADALRHIGMDDVVCNMVAAGEETGQLEAVALRLSDLLETRQQMSQDLLSAVLYPVIILCFGFLVMAILLTWVVPQIVSVFEHSGGQLPMLTQIVIAVSDFLRAYGLMLILSMAGLIFLSLMAMRNPNIRLRRDQLLLRTPMLAPLFKKIEMARFARTLGMLLSGGVSTLAAMLIAKQSFMLMPMTEMGEHARESLREGGNLSDVLRQYKMPHLAVQLIAVGEQSGQLDSMLIRVANQYEQEISRNLKRILTIVEPALMLVMAIMVGLMAVAILLPIVEMNSLVR
ncbi:MAG: type II secretion system F family protein [Zetaproteobacteria bacterium]|nr:type II secretion system F family protein [Zetaproteobacteria bacterium]